jgi:hypothetical protein
MRQQLLPILLALMLTLGLYGTLSPERSVAQTPQMGCMPYQLTVRTGQTFYIPVIVSDTLDLYAWQFSASYTGQYLEFITLLPGRHLRSDGAQVYRVRPQVKPGTTTYELSLAAETRLARASGVNGSGTLAYLQFRALRQKTDGTTVTFSAMQLVDRNALEISKSLINSGKCRVIIRDDAPLLQQPLVGELVYLPMIRRGP